MTRLERMLTIVACVLAAPFAAAAEEASTPDRFSEYVLEVSPQITLAGAIDPQQLREQLSGKVVVINLRTPAEEGVEAEAQAVAELGMEYHNIPVSGPVIDPAQVASLEALLDAAAADEHIVIHCGTGNRAGMLYGATLIDSGTDVEAVLEEVGPIITHAPLKDALRGYADTDTDTDTEVDTEPADAP